MKSKLPNFIEWLTYLSIMVYQERADEPEWHGWEAKQALLFAAKEWEKLIKEIECSGQS